VVTGSTGIDWPNAALPKGGEKVGEIAMDEFAILRRLREATEVEVERALIGSKVSLPLSTTYEALEFFNCLVDVMMGTRDADEVAERQRIEPGFGSTH
jgi:pilus assembly protein TadC